MDFRNRIGLYGAYFLGMAGIGFTLPYLPLYLSQEGLSDRAIGLVSTLAALAGLAQFPIGLWSDRLGQRKPLLVAALAVLALATAFLPSARGVTWLGLLVMLFAENGVCRATVESLAGAEAAAFAPLGEVGAALGALRFWKPISIVLVALVGGMVAERLGVGTILMPLAIVQAAAVVAALLIREQSQAASGQRPKAILPKVAARKPTTTGLRDRAIWLFLAAMVLFHVANAPGGVYLGLFLKRDLAASERYLSYAFVVSMLAWMLTVRMAGSWADHFGRRPLLMIGWATMAFRLALVAIAVAPWQVLAIQVLDGAAQAVFAVVAAAWVTDRLADDRRIGEAQVFVGTALVAGSALGPILAGIVVEAIGYRGMFALLSGIGIVATTIVARFIPETLQPASTPVTTHRRKEAIL